MDTTEQILSTYVKPMRLKVSSIIRMDSVEPRMEGVPLHEFAVGMVIDSRCRCVVGLFLEHGELSDE
jgi:hypothetical protein